MAVLRFFIILGIAALCGLSVYIGGWLTQRGFFWLMDNAGSPVSGPLWGFVGFVPGAAIGAGIAFRIVRRFRIGAEREKPPPEA